jgi:hypothetical protein
MTTLTVRLPDTLNERFQRAFHSTEPGALVLRLLEEAIEREEALRGIIDDLPNRPLVTDAEIREAREEGRT